MKAILHTKYGPPDELQLAEVDKPVPKDNEVLIKVHAASLNDWDWGLLVGKPFIVRLAGGGIRKPKIQILGCDIAGEIETVGAKIKRFKPGDEVYGDLSNYNWGGFAEYVCAREIDLELKPVKMSFEEAAAIPQAAMLAVQGLIDLGQVQTSRKILINGAGGGVGTFAVQLAKLYGAEVTGVDNSGKQNMMLSLGFDNVIDYKEEDFTTNEERYDLILDQKTNRSIFKYLRVLNPNGVYITTGGVTFRLLQTVFFKPWISLFTKKKVHIVALKANKDLVYMNEIYESGKVKPIIDGLFKLNELPKAFQRFGEGLHKGKIIITMKEKL